MSESPPDANHRSWLTKAAYFDAAGDILASHVDPESGKLKDVGQFAKKMQARAVELAARDPNSAVHGWIDGHMADQSFTMLEMLEGFRETRDEQQFTAWTRQRVLEDGTLVAGGLDPDHVDWQAISYALLSHLLSQIQQGPE